MQTEAVLKANGAQRMYDRSVDAPDVAFFKFPLPLSLGLGGPKLTTCEANCSSALIAALSDKYRCKAMSLDRENRSACTAGNTSIYVLAREGNVSMKYCDTRADKYRSTCPLAKPDPPV